MSNSNRGEQLERAIGRAVVLIYSLIGVALLVVLVEFGWSTFSRLQSASSAGELGTLASSPTVVRTLQALAIAMIVSSLAILLAGAALALHGRRKPTTLSKDDANLH